MKFKPSTDEIHSCEIIYGKPLAVMRDRNGKFYCNYCNGLLKLTQLHPRIIELIEREKRKEDRYGR